MSKVAVGLSVCALVGVMALAAVVVNLRAENAELAAQVVRLSSARQDLEERMQRLELQRTARDEAKAAQRLERERRGAAARRGGAQRKGHVPERRGPDPAESVEDALRYVLTAGMDNLSREARVVPNFEDGRTNGFKLFAIRRRSNLRALGFRNNDVITAVNDMDLSNTEAALDVFEAQKDAPRWTVSVLREGQPLEMTFERPEGL